MRSLRNFWCRLLPPQTSRKVSTKIYLIKTFKLFRSISNPKLKRNYTRMHSSRMRIARFSSFGGVFVQPPGCRPLASGCGPPPLDVDPFPWIQTPTPWMQTHLVANPLGRLPLPSSGCRSPFVGKVYPPNRGQTNTCENITLLKVCLLAVNMKFKLGSQTAKNYLLSSTTKFVIYASFCLQSLETDIRPLQFCEKCHRNRLCQE